MIAMPCLSERALASLATLLAAIQPANGYATDAGQRVFRARSSIDKRETPCVNLWEGQEQPDADSKSKDKRTVTLFVHIEGHVVADADDTGVQLGRIKADIKRAVCGGSPSGGLPDPPNPRAFALVSYEGAVPTPRADGAHTEAVTVTFSLRYPEAYDDPTTTG